MIPDHADPVVQHDAESDTAELLEYKVVENILDGRHTKGITWLELLECSTRLLETVNLKRKYQIGSQRLVR